MILEGMKWKFLEMYGGCTYEITHFGNFQNFSSLAREDEQKLRDLYFRCFLCMKKYERKIS